MARGRRYCLVLIGVFLLSIFALRPVFSKTATYKPYMESIDKRKDEVMMISASSATSSALLTVLPEDWATPIAEELADLTNAFLVVLAILYTEKYLLPIIGFIATVFLIPGSCILGILYILKPKELALKQIAIRMLVLAIVSMLVVPTSVWVSDSIDTTFEETIEEIKNKALDGEKTLVEESENTQESSQNIFQKVGNAISKIWKDVTEGAKSLLNKARDTLSYYVEYIATRIVIDCIVPVLVIFAYAILIKYTFKLPYKISDISKQLNPTKRKREKTYLKQIKQLKRDGEDKE